MKHWVVCVLASLVAAIVGVIGCAIAAEESYINWSVAAWWIAGISIAIGVIAMCISWLEDNGHL